MATGPIPQDEIPQIRRNSWADNFFRPLLVTIMILCFNISVVTLVRLVNPTWRGIYFLGGIILVTIEAIYSYRILRSWRLGSGSLFRYRVAEWVVLIVLLKLLNWAGKPTALIWAELQAMWYNPLNVINVEFYIVVILGIIAWSAATSTMADFELLYDPYSYYARPLDSLATRFFWGGTILVVISGISQWLVKVDLSGIIDFQRPSLGGILLNVLVYFMAGLVLLSQANLTRLTVGWEYQKIKVTAELAKQWAKYGLVLLGVITAIVFFLPTSYTLGFLNSAGILVQNILQFLVFLIQLLIYLFLLPFMWLASLFEPPAEPQRFLPPQMPALPPSAPTAPPPPWLEVVKSLMFWLLVLTTVAYFTKVYFNDHPELSRLLRSFRPVNLVLSLWQQLWRRLWDLTQSGLEMMPKKIKFSRGEASTPAADGAWSWLSLRRLSPRAQIIRYYLNILQRAQKHGYPRKTNQTPYEYEPDLGETAPNVQPEIKALTESFVQARYGQEAVAEEEKRSVKRYWQRIRRELRKRGQNS